MISMLKGQIVELNPESVTVDVSGVGYEAQCSFSTISALKMGQTTQIHIYTHVREDALVLFGFSARAEKQLFLTLLKVNGIGPKMAINILSGASVDQIHDMIEREDAKALSKLPKVGKKTAEQMILTLKGKLVPQESGAPVAIKINGPTQEIYSALVNLGFRSQDVEKVVGQMPKDIDLQNGIRQGLSALTSI